MAVEIFSDGAAFDLAFSDWEGRVYESLGLRQDQIMVLYFEPSLPEAKTAMATAYAAQQSQCTPRFSRFEFEVIYSG